MIRIDRIDGELQFHYEMATNPDHKTSFAKILRGLKH